MSSPKVKGQGTKNDPWVLKTPPGRSEYQVYRDEAADPPALVCIVGKTQLSYQLRCLEDLHATRSEYGDWMPLGRADAQKHAKEGSKGPGAVTWAKNPNDLQLDHRVYFPTITNIDQR